MSFDTGTWWLIATICVVLTSALAYLIKRALFIKVDKIESRVEFIEKTHVLKLDHDKDIEKCDTDIEKIRESYATKKDLKEVKSEIKKDLEKLQTDVTDIKQNSLLREDFFRAQVSNEQNFQRLYDLFLKNRGEITNG